jgi:PIN domain nuclease of toxin-antitoxin system
MKLLLDTQIFLWLILGDEKLPENWKDEILNTENEVYLSVASVWEIIVKYKLGKLPLPKSPEDFLPEQRKNHEILSLSLDEESVRLLAHLPDHHKDPFDRMMICQALHHKMAFVSVDIEVQKYPVALLPQN